MGIFLILKTSFFLTSCTQNNSNKKSNETKIHKSATLDLGSYKAATAWMR